MIDRVLVKKKDKFATKAREVENEFREFLGITGLEKVEIINQYLVSGLSKEQLKQAIRIVFSDAPVDVVLDDIPSADVVIATELLPGQFDARAASASECIMLLFPDVKVKVRCAQIYLIYGDLNEEEVEKCKKHLINLVEMRQASLDIPKTLDIYTGQVEKERSFGDFNNLAKDELLDLIKDLSLSMDIDDISLCQDYFTKIGRAPTLTEIKIIDTYWSDHCRHTTFNTNLKNIEIEDDEVMDSYQRYLKLKEEVGRENKPTTLMDLGTVVARVLKKREILINVDESDEINACTVKVKVDVDGELQDWLYLFKNETHNHPTEIEPFGGAATCVGGAIRDPLSGRSYVYQAMRITGAANPTQDINDTLSGKLPQRKICKDAARGFSSYGNQIGLATGLVDEVYHEGYLAKRMEIGAVVGAAPIEAVVRKTPKAGDVVVLLGGRTGRDGIGGATGSSKSHEKTSILTCGSEVQKGNPPTERKIQRLFRNPEATKMIVRCNDFGAGGASIAIGELAHGLEIDLNKVPLKYLGLTPTEIAISESQERMACVIERENAESFIKLANQENLEAFVVAKITDDDKVVLAYDNNKVCEIDRDFLDTNGAKKTADVCVTKKDTTHEDSLDLSFKDRFMKMVSDLNICSKKGLVDMFDSTIGASNVIAPFGGKYQKTPAIAMVSKFPTKGETSTVSGMAWGFNPELSSKDPYVGGYMAVVDSLTKLICAGFSRHDAYFSFQEYFKKLGDDPKNWGLPFSALLGTLDAQMDLEVAAIGGKDSMSGTFDNISVPPTLVSFATAISDANVIITPEFKTSGSEILLICPKVEGSKLNSESLTACLDTLNELIISKKILSASTPGCKGVAESIFKMCLGNKIGVDLSEVSDGFDLFNVNYGSLILEVEEDLEDDVISEFKSAKLACAIGKTTSDFSFSAFNEKIELCKAQSIWEGVLEKVYPTKTKADDTGEVNSLISYHADPKKYTGPALLTNKPRVAIPVFPGTNCEFDTLRAFEVAGASPEIFVIRDLSANDVRESALQFSRLIEKSQILMLPGGFSGADEPDGSAKLISAFLREKRISEAIGKLIDERDGLILGICNGFQALLKLGLLPYGKITTPKDDDPTLSDNLISRHQSTFVNTTVTSTLSPWMSQLNLGKIYKIPISHGQGRFVCTDEMLDSLIANGQVCTQYVDDDGKAISQTSVNPNGSVANIEAICSADGRILGKMGHSERRGDNLYKNIYGNCYQELFESGVDYFRS